MRAAAATAGMLSAAVLLSSGCGRGDERKRGDAEDPVRLAAFRVLAARDFFATCPGAAGRIEMVRAVERFDELKGFAIRKGAGQSLWRAENDYAGLSRHGGREPCGEGDAEYGQALASLNGALDVLGGRIAAIPQ